MCIPSAYCSIFSGSVVTAGSKLGFVCKARLRRLHGHGVAQRGRRLPVHASQERPAPLYVAVGPPPFPQACFPHDKFAWRRGWILEHPPGLLYDDLGDIRTPGRVGYVLQYGGPHAWPPPYTLWAWVPGRLLGVRGVFEKHAFQKQNKFASTTRGGARCVHHGESERGRPRTRAERGHPPAPSWGDG